MRYVTCLVGLGAALLALSACEKRSAEVVAGHPAVRGVWNGTASAEGSALGLYKVILPKDKDAAPTACKAPKVPLDIVCSAVAVCPNMIVTIGHCITDTLAGIPTKETGITTSATISTKDDPTCALPPPRQYYWKNAQDDPKNPRIIQYPKPERSEENDGITAVYLPDPLPQSVPFVDFEAYEFKDGDKATLIGYGENIVAGWTSDSGSSWYERRSGELPWQSTRDYYATFARGGTQDDPVAAMGGDSGAGMYRAGKARGVVQSGSMIGKGIPMTTYVYLITPDVAKMLAKAKQDWCPAEPTPTATPTVTDTPAPAPVMTTAPGGTATGTTTGAGGADGTTGGTPTGATITVTSPLARATVTPLDPGSTLKVAPTIDYFYNPPRASPTIDYFYNPPPASPTASATPTIDYFYNPPPAMPVGK